ncbi:hypothetical protein COT52_01560 [candidate division WWE3 bacterium CG08_land_8_20_14_0_20_43_13]|uniref:Glycogen synthase n=1 Tax=candidate division WWE3 bacterium CG08_land_8_20_14_0_20_43_13 TaxID=1975087 RepID=A0A2H0X7P6_UNCKA|nr:MAG: hypothetical protein COT52_01560 [candidate division WWE3 bacterium CG08_land_8_20_14_0_20_43_13]
MRVLFPIGECTPLAKVGGLGDIGGSLSKALQQLGLTVEVIMPRYETVLSSGLVLEPAEFRFGVDWEGKHHLISVYTTVIPDSGVKVWLLENEEYLSRGPIHFGSSALDESRQGFNRFSFFNLCIVEFLKKYREEYQVIHAHDWHTGLLFPLLKMSGIKIPTLFTVHNMYYQGCWDKSCLEDIRSLIEPYLYSSPRSGEQDKVNFLAQGLGLADAINTVSPTYAKEVLTPEFGEGLSPVILGRPDGIAGILNGIDLDFFNPATDSFIAKNYNVASWREGKNANKQAVCRELGWDESNVALAVMVARLGVQKGVEIVLEAFEHLLERPWRLVILGIGDDYQEKLLTQFNRHHHGRFMGIARFDEPLAHRLYAAGDFFLAPSRFEPCGLTQMIAMRYGALPIARATGGFLDTIQDGIDGFLFNNYSSEDLAVQLDRALGIYRHDSNLYQAMVGGAMGRDFSWDDSAEKYAEVYRSLV